MTMTSWDYDTSTEGLEVLARELLASKPTDSFAAWDDRVWTTHVPTLGTNRDADVLVQCNWAQALEDFAEFMDDEAEQAQRHSDPPLNNDVFIGRFGHWACGWVEQLFVRVYADDGSFTAAFQQAAEMLAALESYPVLNDERLWELESEEAFDTLQYYDGVTKENQNFVFQFLMEDNAPDDWSDEMVAEAVAEYKAQTPGELP